MDVLAAVWGVASNVISVLAVAVGGPSLLLWRLGRKDANRKLTVEEGGLGVSRFNAIAEAYQDQLDRADARITTLEGVLRGVMAKLSGLHRLVTRYAERTGVAMTPDELIELETTRPDFPA